jgi:glutathione synthase/RimK-type ligase-like ATP-grasp enzyme
VTDLAVLFEHPQWFAPLFAALDRRGVSHISFGPDGHWNPADTAIPAPVVLNRIAMSSFLRADEHPIFHTMALLDHWRRSGARVVNGADVMAVDASKARQLALIASLGLGIPETRVVHRAADIEAAAATLSFPLVVKANIGGSGAGIMRSDNIAELRWAVAEKQLPVSVDGVLLVQNYVPARGGTITRIETLNRKYLYAIEIAGGGAFDLCPADACVADSNISMKSVEPAPELIAAVETISRAMNLDVGGIEVMIDDRDGVPRFYDINALSNFVAQPLNVLGWDPHEKLIDWLDTLIAEAKS